MDRVEVSILQQWLERRSYLLLEYVLHTFESIIQLLLVYIDAIFIVLIDV